MVFQRRYDWNTFKGLSVEAQTVGEVLERLESENGSVSKEAFLDASRPVNSPTHGLFEWDDATAAERYRLVQSGRYIRDLRVTMIRHESDVKTMDVQITESAEYEGRGFMNAGESRLSGVTYNSALNVLRDSQKRKNALSHAKTELRIFRRKYDSFRELQGVMAEIDKLLYDSV